MKKGLVFSSAILATLALASCSSNEVIDGGDDALASSGQVIEIAVENAGSGLESRSGRPLYSSEAAQDIDNVKVVIVEDKQGTKKVVAEELITNWMKSDKVLAYDDASGHGRKIRIELTGDDNFTKVDGATYTIYAIGYSDDTSYKVGNQSLSKYLENVINDSETTLENLALVNQNTDRNKAEEIFAGSATLEFSKESATSSKFSQGVTLHRQVAGIFTYVKNIPCAFNATGTVGTKLQLVAAKTNLNLILGSFYGMTLSNNGGKDNGQNGTQYKEPNTLMNVVNGTENRGGTEQVIYTIKLSDWFTKLQDVNNDGILDRYEYKQDRNGKLVEDTENQIWKNPLRGEEQNQIPAATFVKGSAFGGEFIIPFQKVDGKMTFQLRLVDDSDTPIQSWSIYLPTDDQIARGTNFTSWSGSVWNTVTDYEDSKEFYSVLRNHLYGVGRKDSAKPTAPNPTDPEKPTDPEQPQDLNTKQSIMLQVNDNWEVIHKMEVE